VKIRRHGAVWLVFAIALHHEVRRRPVRMAIEQRAYNAAVQHPRKRLMVRLSMPRCNDLVAFGKAVDVQALFICRAAAEADAVR